MSTDTETEAVTMEMMELTAPPAYEAYQPRNLLMTPLHYFYLLFLVLFYIFNLIVFFFCFWLVAMESESYLLDVAVAGNKKPPMRWVIGLGLASGAISMLVCSFGVLGLYGKVRSVLIVFVLGLAIVSFMQVGMGLIAREFKLNYDEAAITNFTYDLARNQYGMDVSAKVLMDKIQYYNDCCGATQPEDYQSSKWFKKYEGVKDRSYVPKSCCKMEDYTTFLEMKPLHPTCNKVTYDAQIFNVLVKRKGCATVFSKKVLQYPALFEFLGLFMTFYTVCVLIFVLLMIDKDLYYDLSLFQ